MGRQERVKKKVAEAKAKADKINKALDERDRRIESHKFNFNPKTKKWEPKK